MLIYNFQKEFLGIDEKDLRTLGFKDLAGLRAEVTDFADLFVKTPGYIHNFKHVHWIDFITCAESNEESKVIINVNNKNYKCVLQIHTAYLVDGPSSKAYMVHLNNLRELSVKESESISGDIVQRELPQEVTQTQEIFNTPEELNDNFTQDEYEEEVAATPLTPDPYEAPIEIDMSEEESESASLKIEDSLDMDDLSLDVDFEDDFSDPLEVTLEEEIPLPATETIKEDFDNGYTYDPSVASDELGLPLDLIEEFIQDFIEQAKEFRPALYTALEEQDLDNLRILSHKLKGVAANLRIEDALETLTIANTSSDLNVIEENLDTLYKIIAKLAGEEISVEKEIVTPPTVVTPVEEVSAALDLDFKDEFEDDLYSDPVTIADPVEPQVPLKIEMPELADDTFVGEDETPLDLLDIDQDDTPDIPEAPTYSKDAVASEIGIDKESFNELFDDYLQEANSLSSSLQSALADDDVQTCKSEALKLKGMSDNMRITSFSEDLETIIHATDTQEIQSAVANVSAEIAQLSN